MPIIDTPAEGFPLPTMTPPTRTLRDVARLLTPGARRRAVERGEVYRAAGETFGAAHARAAHEVREEERTAVPDMFDREVGIGTFTPHVNMPCTLVPAGIPLFPDSSVDGILTSVLSGEIDRRLARPHVLTFADGRAYERGATLRRNVGAKSLGSRRVQAQGVATDYLRDDPTDGPRLAALLLAGFMGQDPETVR